MAIDTEKLLTILTAAQNPAFKKLLEERTRKQEEKAKIETDLIELDEKIATLIPPELLALLSPLSKTTDAPKTRKRKSKQDESAEGTLENKLADTTTEPVSNETEV